MFRHILCAAALVVPLATAAPVAQADTKTVRITGPSCPPPGGQRRGRPRATKDKDGDGKADRLYGVTRDKNGNDIQIWCLDHGRTGDYAVYASRPGKADVKIAACYLVCGNNRWTLEIKDGVFTKFRGRNWDRRRPPRGLTTDYEFYYDYATGKAREVTTDKGKPVSSRRALLDHGDLPGFALRPGTDPMDFALDTSDFDAWVREYDFERPGTPAGPGTFDFVDTDEFENWSGQRLSSFDTAAGPVDLLHHWQALMVEDVGYDPAAATLTFALAAVGDGAALTLAIPRELIDADKAGFDTAFAVAIDGEPVSDVTDDASDTDRVLTIPVPEGAAKLTVRGTTAGREIILPVIDSPMIAPRHGMHPPPARADGTAPPPKHKHHGSMR